MMGPVALLTVVVLAVFVGFEVVSKVTSKLHTPLMSGANAIHGIILVGAIIVAGQASDPWVLGIALLAVVLATVNLVGGFVVTDRMLEMFSAHKRSGTPARTVPAKAGGAAAGGNTSDGHAGNVPTSDGHISNANSGGANSGGAAGEVR
ncbi:NAD(P) transhydrogenase subunit alpha [Arthrobacter sp. 2MCAF15]|uniref:NAD(P) transhydrogenase subunit alpha n=1 Tax=Arthrobacter sp. 2MCAF15 TaxID=3232984 RepID=UPI003F9295D0